MVIFFINVLKIFYDHVKMHKTDYLQILFPLAIGM